MKVISPKYLAFVSVVFVLFFSANSNASFITPSSTHVDQISIVASNTVTGNTDLVHVRAANSAGISVNRFDRFEVTDTPLNLVNLPREGALPSAKRVIIIADTIVLNNTVKLVGPASDILFLSTDTAGSISCNACVLNNFKRITFAAANPEVTLADTASTIGNLNTSASGFIDINGLTAPGSIALEMAANVLSLNGDIITHQRANKDTLGGYKEDINGAYTIGTGSVNLLLGTIKWNYDTQKLNSLSYSASHNILNGSLESVAVKITASSDLTLNTHIDTRTDLISSVRYENLTYIPDEGLNIQSIGASSLAINGNQESNGDVIVKTTGDLSLESNSTYISGNNIELIAEGEIVTSAIIDADHLQIAALAFQNEGYLSSDHEVEIWAKKHLINQYGGKLTADSVKLQSVEGLVRNGSRTAYRDSDSIYQEVFVFDPAHMLIEEPARQGTFYNLDVEIRSPSDNYVRAADSSAKIAANKVEISAVSFENINPYYKRVNDDGMITLEREYIEQVSVSAENSLIVHATEYIINSSAFMQVHNEDGIVHLRTALLNNERYRNLSVLDKVESVTNVFDPETQVFIGQETSTTIGTKSVFYSPPAFLISMGDLNIEASQSFINNQSYLEVFGDAKFDTPVMNDIGMGHSIYQKNITPTGTWMDLSSWFFIDRIFIPGSHEVTLDVTDNEMDSLFFVQNKAEFSNSTTMETTQIFRNHTPIETYIQQFVDSKTVEDLSTTFDNSDYVATELVIHNNHNHTYTDEKQTLLVDWTVRWNETILVEYPGGVVISEITPTHVYESGRESYSIFDELMKLYDEIVDYISDVYAEFDWWD